MGKQLNVGLLGCGSVGRGLVELVGRNEGLLRERTGVELNISKILVRDLKKEQPALIAVSSPRSRQKSSKMVVTWWLSS